MAKRRVDGKQLASKLSDLKNRTQRARAELKVREEQRDKLLEELKAHGVASPEEAETRLTELDAEASRMEEEIAAEIDELETLVYGKE